MKNMFSKNKSQPYADIRKLDEKRVILYLYECNDEQAKKFIEHLDYWSKKVKNIAPILKSDENYNVAAHSCYYIYSTGPIIDYGQFLDQLEKEIFFSDFEMYQTPKDY